jgi:hypothetical protein
MDGHSVAEVNMAARDALRCRVEHAGTIFVRAREQNGEAWDGAVEVLNLVGHREARRAFAWGYADSLGKIRYVTMLDVPPIDSPSAAVSEALRSGRMARG